MENTSIISETPVLQDNAASLRAGSTLLGSTQPGFRGRICGIDARDVICAYTPSELERRLLEMGFVEGCTVEVLHQGTFNGDPIAVRVGPCTVALRRRDAMAIIVD